MERFASFFGIFVLLGIGYLCSTDRKRVPWRLVATALALQLLLAAFLVKERWVPGLLWVLCGGSAVALAADSFRRIHENAGWIARTVGTLSAITAFLCFAIQMPWIWGWIVGVGGLAGLFTVRLLAPKERPNILRACAIAGSVGVLVLLQAKWLPTTFAFVALAGIGDAVMWLVGFAKDGADFVFGGLREAGGGFVFAIDVGAIILLFSALMSVLYYIRVLPWLVGLMAQVLHKALGVSGAESLSAAANVFAGQTEAPLVVRPYLARMTKSETMALMTGGFATIAGSVLGAYVAILQRGGLERGAADLIAASVMSAPAAFVFAKLFVPETETPETIHGAAMPRLYVGRNLLDALAGGVTAGLRLAVNVVAMLLVFYALIKLINASVDWAVFEIFGAKGVTFQRIYACLFAPFAFLMGVTWDDCVLVGELIGTKTIFNEFIAYERLGEMIEGRVLSTRSAVLSTYALCGFANFMSIGIQIGGLSPLAPDKRPMFAGLALRAMIGGALACQLTACIVGVIGDF